MTDIHEKPEWAQSKRDKINADLVERGLKPKPRFTFWAVLVLAAIAALGYVLTREQTGADVVQTSSAELIMTLRQSETLEIAPSPLRQTVKVTGTLAPATQAHVTAQVAGQVLTIAVRPGDSVQEGDVLAQLDTETLEIQLNQQRATAEATRAQLVSSEQQLQRTEELAAQGLATPSTLEQARAATAALKANLTALESVVRSAELSLAKATVRAPMGGIVSARSADAGQTVGGGTSLFTIVDLAQMEYQASASVSASALVQVGQRVEVTVSGLEGERFSGTVSRVNPVATSGSRTVTIYFVVENPDGKLRGGMFATGNITVFETQDAIAIPAVALREDAEGFYVLALDGSALRRQAVVPGKQWDRGRTIEVSGVSVGDRIVSLPLTQLVAGSRFQIAED